MATPVAGGVRSARDALVIAVLGDPGGDLLDPHELDLAAFWPRFDACAPIHVSFGFRVATVAIGSVLPRLLGHRRSLRHLDADAADRVVSRAAELPGFGLVAEVAKIVACFAYFSDPRAESVVRGVR